MLGWFCALCDRFNNTWHKTCWACDGPQQEIRKLAGSK